MNFLIITHTDHYLKKGKYFAYAPYVREMQLWEKYTDQLSIIAPEGDEFDPHILDHYQHSHIQWSKVPAFSLTSKAEILKAIRVIPKIIRVIYHQMRQADHIHLRCPGNMGLLGCLVQILFPNKPKTAKYAGNWHPQAKQPWSYRLQKWLLSNTTLTKNMQALVYGQWPDQTKNIRSFFTATYRDEDIQSIKTRDYTHDIHFCFVGSLVKGKQPLKALAFIKALRANGVDAVLHFYGNGELKAQLEEKIQAEELNDHVFLYGNQPREKVQKALYHSHFMVLPSRSEGWPKAVAEAMFWGCIPIVPRISCVPWMLGEGERGLLMEADNPEKEVQRMMELLAQPQALEKMAEKAAHWSQQYTLDKFEEEIKKLI